ncbi:MAG: lytic transglycosylase domain-containing protein [Firmicutes bacterium]|nr:transglycosylase SLT domain-containing protein [Alicyclobacillaceae bacterium]MCL6497035.1 lytic transglycosylase domain-containing protein [Bacillota bacterium]
MDDLWEAAQAEGRRRLLWWLIGGGAGCLAPLLLVLVAVIAVAVLVAGIGGWIAGFFGSGAAPAIATPMSRPAEWLGLATAAGLRDGVPNVVALAAIEQASGGQALNDRYYCGNGLTTGGPCADFYPGVATLGTGYGLVGIGSRSGLVPAGQDPHDTAWNVQTGLQALGRYLAQPYWQQALDAFHQAVQAPPGWHSASDYAGRIQALIQQYDAGPQLGAWALAPWNGKTGQWEDPGNQPEWVFAVAAAPVGATGAHQWQPPTTVCDKNGCHTEYHWLTYTDLAPPIQVWGTTARGQHVPFRLSTADSAIPVWPGGTVWGAQAALSGPNRLTLISAEWANGVMDTIHWPPQSSGGTGGTGYVQRVSDQQALDEWWPEIQIASQQTGVPANWIAAEMLVESHGDQFAGQDGLAGAYGLMQLEPDTARGLPGWYPGARQNPQENLILGAELLAENYAQTGSWELAAAEYYGGLGNMERVGYEPGMTWEQAQPLLSAPDAVPDPGAGNSLTMAAYAETVAATAQWVAQHAPSSS